MLPVSLSKDRRWSPLTPGVPICYYPRPSGHDPRRFPIAKPARNEASLLAGLRSAGRGRGLGLGDSYPASTLSRTVAGHGREFLPPEHYFPCLVGRLFRIRAHSVDCAISSSAALLSGHIRLPVVTRERRHLVRARARYRSTHQRRVRPCQRRPARVLISDTPSRSFHTFRKHSDLPSCTVLRVFDRSTRLESSASG